MKTFLILFAVLFLVACGGDGAQDSPQYKLDEPVKATPPACEAGKVCGQCFTRFINGLPVTACL